MVSRLAGRVSRIEEKLTPSGGSTLLRLLYEVRGAEYVPQPGDELITLEDLVRASMRQGKEAGTDPVAPDGDITKAPRLGGIEHNTHDGFGSIAHQFLGHLGLLVSGSRSLTLGIS